MGIVAIAQMPSFANADVANVHMPSSRQCPLSCGSFCPTVTVQECGVQCGILCKRTCCAFQGAAHYGGSIYGGAGGFPSDSATLRLSPALTDAELRRWVIKPGTMPWKHAAVNPSRADVLGYTPSEAEQVWLTGQAKGHICDISNQPLVKAAADAWVAYAASPGVWAPGGKPPARPSPEQVTALSHFELAAKHATRRQWAIEPLHGIARHPNARVGCGGDASLLDLTYLVLHNDCGNRVHGAAKPTVRLFDMGASKGFFNISGGIPAAVRQGSSHAPSMPLLYRLYQDRCLEPDAIYSWEVRKGVTSDQWWGSAPASLRSKTHFFEVPVVEGALDEALAGKPNPSSFLQMLAVTSKPEDFVVVKLDIDTPAIEQTIVAVLTQRPELAALIDELFFEYHFYYDGLDFGWGDNVQGDVDTAIGTMFRLRSLGIRAHFWI